MEQIQETVRHLENLLNPDHGVQQEAERYFLKSHLLDLQQYQNLVELIKHAQENKYRVQSAVLLQKIVSFYWRKLSDQIQQYILGQIIQVIMESDSIAMLRITADIFKQLLKRVDFPNHWT